MQSPKNQEYYYEDKEKIQDQENPTTTIISEQNGDIVDSTTSSLLKNKKRVHYPQVNGGQTVKDNVKTDSLQQNYDKTISGKKKRKENIHHVRFN